MMAGDAQQHGTPSNDFSHEIIGAAVEAALDGFEPVDELHRVHLVNYTFLATHHLFMAGRCSSTCSMTLLTRN